MTAPVAVQMHHAEFADFVGKMRDTFGQQVEATLHKNLRFRWLRCERCKRVFHYPDHPTWLAGVAGVSCACGHVVGLAGVIWLRSQNAADATNKCRVFVTPALSPMGETRQEQHPC